MKKILDQNSGNEIEQRTNFEKFSPPTQFRVGGAVDPIASAEHFLQYLYS